MKDFLNLVLIVLVFSLIIMQPSYLKEFSTTPLGKLLFIILVVGFAVKHVVLSFFILILFISLNNSSYESFIETMSNVDDFKKKNCKDNKLVNKKSLKNVKFTGEKCNPCDSNCKYTLTTSNEQLTQKEAVTPKDSKDSFVIKEALKSNGHVEPFSNVLEKMTLLDEH